MKYYLIAGERSGDLHGGNLIKHLKRKDNNSQFRGFGGNGMQSSGMELVQHYEQMAFMGFLEVIKNLKAIKHLLAKCKSDIVSYQPDVVILIDYGGFNMKIAGFCKKTGIRTFYYISPKVWAWNTKRALRLKATVDRMFVILPFEVGFFRRFNWEVDYVGNPVLDAIKAHKPKPLKEDGYVALLPGSRPQELSNSLPIFRKVVEGLPKIQFLLAAVDSVDATMYSDILNLHNLKLIKGNTYDILANAQAAVVTSGTATLETALLKVPQVVTYATSSISYLIAKSLIKVDYISLVNLIVGRPVVKELIQGQFTANNVIEELKELINNSTYRRDIGKRYDELYATLDIGSASENTAELMTRYLNESKI
ncbi:MAG: lipid-A-disaccharide synthase [Bacteroidota bacterium]